MLDLSYPNILNNFKEHIAPKRSESAAFLIWFFENYLRLDTLTAVDSVCDQAGDKGIDGIFLNEESNAIEVYQSKLFQKQNPTVGDKSLREFLGTIAQVESEDAIDNLIQSAGNAEVARLAERLNLKKHVSEFDVIGYFVCNGILDQNGEDFLGATPNIRFIGTEQLQESYISSDRDLPNAPPASFDIAGYEVSEYIVDADHRAIIAPIKANELVELEGIADQSLFAYNVRGPLGRTKVNRDITQSISENNKHKLFPLFHNGITVVADILEKDSEKIGIERYFIVNGCQSINALYQNRRNITDDLRILTKFIKADPDSDLARMITKNSNNQNGVKARDFKSNNQIQIRLQNEVREFYGNNFYYEIKRGENTHDLDVISNEVAGQYLMAFDLKEPWATHRKYQIFEDKHSHLFGRPSVTAHRIVLCHTMIERINEAKDKIDNQLFARYALTQFLILYVLRLILEEDEGGNAVIEAPENFILENEDRNIFGKAISELLDEVTTDLDAEIKQLGDDFDYRGKLRDESWCNNLAYEVASTHRKLVGRKRLESFKELYERLSKEDN